MFKLTDWIILVVIVFFVAFCVFLQIENKSLEKNLKETQNELIEAYTTIENQNRSIQEAHKQLNDYNASLTLSQETIELLRRQTKQAITNKSCEETRKILIEVAKENR